MFISFLKIPVGDYTEIGEFQSVRACHATTKKTTPLIRQIDNEPKNTTTTCNCTCAQPLQNPEIGKQIVDHLMSDVHRSIEKAINLAQQMPVNYSHEQTM